ncbi:MAG TPA: DUF2283 domain-containing protein [Candidatus Binatia bacterium]
MILDYDRDGNPISLEILEASKRVTDTRKGDFQLAERSRQDNRSSRLTECGARRIDLV